MYCKYEHLLFYHEPKDVEEKIRKTTALHAINIFRTRLSREKIKPSVLNNMVSKLLKSTMYMRRVFETTPFPPFSNDPDKGTKTLPTVTSSTPENRQSNYPKVGKQVTETLSLKSSDTKRNKGVSSVNKVNIVPRTPTVTSTPTAIIQRGGMDRRVVSVGSAVGGTDERGIMRRPVVAMESGGYSGSPQVPTDNVELKIEQIQQIHTTNVSSLKSKINSIIQDARLSRQQKWDMESMIDEKVGEKEVLESEELDSLKKQLIRYMRTNMDGLVPVYDMLRTPPQAPRTAPRESPALAGGATPGRGGYAQKSPKAMAGRKAVTPRKGSYAGTSSPDQG